MSPKWVSARFSDGCHNAFFIPRSLSEFFPCIQLRMDNQIAGIDKDLLQPTDHLFALCRHRQFCERQSSSNQGEHVDNNFQQLSPFYNKNRAFGSPDYLLRHRAHEHLLEVGLSMRPDNNKRDLLISFDR